MMERRRTERMWRKRLTAPILRADKADVLRPLGTLAYPLFKDLEADVPEFVRGGRHAATVGRVKLENLNQGAVLRVARTDDGRLATAGHGKFACFEIETGAQAGVLAVMALKALAFDEGLNVAGEIDFVGDANGIEPIIRVIVRTVLAAGAVGEEKGGREAECGKKKGSTIHKVILVPRAGGASCGAGSSSHALWKLPQNVWSAPDCSSTFSVRTPHFYQAKPVRMEWTPAPVGAILQTLH